MPESKGREKRLHPAPQAQQGQGRQPPVVRAGHAHPDGARAGLGRHLLHHEPALPDRVDRPLELAVGFGLMMAGFAMTTSLALTRPRGSGNGPRRGGRHLPHLCAGARSRGWWRLSTLSTGRWTPCTELRFIHRVVPSWDKSCACNTAVGGDASPPDGGEAPRQPRMSGAAAYLASVAPRRTTTTSAIPGHCQRRRSPCWWRRSPRRSPPR